MQALEVTIIGAGISGLSLAIFLRSNSVACRIYEAAASRQRLDNGSMQLGPNCLSILHRYDILDRILSYGNEIEIGEVKDNNGNITGYLPLGSKEVCGYPGLRIHRKVFVQQLLLAFEALGGEVNFGKRLTNILDDSVNGVRCEFSDGSTTTSTLLVAADGIHSSIRQRLFPSIVPNYSGAFGVGGSVSMSDVMRDVDVDVNPCGLYRGNSGTFILLKQNLDGTDLMAYKQRPLPERTREEWKSMFTDTTMLRNFVQEGCQEWPQWIQNAIKSMNDESMWAWPIYTLPELPSWTSSSKRILLIGDAAHAMPPAAAQGGNMAIEDGYILALLLAKVDSSESLDKAISLWYDLRHDRVGKVLQLSQQLMQSRLPSFERAQLDQDQVFNYSATNDEAVKRWLWLWKGIEDQERIVSQAMIG